MVPFERAPRPRDAPQETSSGGKPRKPTPCPENHIDTYKEAEEDAAAISTGTRPYDEGAAPDEKVSRDLQARTKPLAASAWHKDPRPAVVPFLRKSVFRRR